ncbi:D-glucuronyl C5-epimerase [Planococcus citri]|uniref:D-glucuronyl C5-epimerase n=1 Tax=Planococcus citri TaxID=170843 RepID=UPI0031F8F481
MRYKLRLFIVILVAHALVAVFIWSWFINGDITEQPRVLAFAASNLRKFESDKSKDITFKEIPCNINGEYNISCRKESDEIYLPFTFIKKYFEVYGKLVEKDGSEIFNWSHSYANYYSVKRKYDPRGIFTHFQTYKVEERERVKCISASEGVPLSTQWDPKGYYYPTQIAQFGLSHYSKAILEPELVKRVLEDGEDNQANWIVSHVSSIKRDVDDDADSQVLCFDTAENKPIMLHINDTLPILSFDLKLNPKGSNEFVVEVKNIVEKLTYYLHYDCNGEHINVSGDDIYYGLICNGRENWYKLSRDIFIDVQKGVMLKTKTKPKFQRSSLKIFSIQLKGKGCVDNVTLASNNHMTQFYLTVNWLLKHQDETTGGWVNPVTRKMAGSLLLKPGWYSAMGQGHALSVLARAYYISDKNTKYLEAARKALGPFKVLSKNHGVLAMYMHELHWYEEYPTDPPTFVLNGFIYSLIGLYDFHTLATVDYSHEPYMLYVQGMTSLKKLLLAFDTGSGTTYDLRHMSLGIAPKLARWDYHATHINQLLLLSSIDKDPLFSNTAKRWIGYMSGKRASHN